VTEPVDDYHIPKGEAEVVEQLEAEQGRELAEQERNLAVAQARPIGDIDDC
jgi:hypothetical protein